MPLLDAAMDEDLADLGELAGPLAHEFNNLLNNLLLHLAVLEADLPPTVAAEIVEIRRQTARVVRLVQQFQQLRRRRLGPGRPVDLAQQVNAAAEALTRDTTAPTGPVRLELPVGLPPVWASEADLRRLCLFLLRNAARHAAAEGQEVCVGAEAANGRVRLRVEDPGPPRSDAQLLQTFDPHGDSRPGTNGLELAACASLARRMHGRLSAEHREGGGAMLVLDLPAGAEERTTDSQRAQR